MTGKVAAMAPALMLGLGAAALAALVVVTVVVTVRRARLARQRVEAQLAGSRREVEQLAHQVDRLAAEVAMGRRRAAGDHEYVITTLAEAAQVSGAPLPEPSVPGAPLAEVLERQAVARLAQVDTTTPVGARIAHVGVKAVALAHGLRRALSQDNLDRASAEAHVARRRSRRTRRQELREARRLLRAVRAQQPGRAAGSEDAA
jgi:hypothetical protein